MAEARKVRVRAIDRQQLVLRPVDVERLVAEDHPVRAVWEFVGRLDLSALYAAIAAVEGAPGRDATDPRLLVSLWIYAYSEGISSAREIERLCGYHPAYQWLTGMEPVNHHTLSDFRVDQKTALDELFVQVLGVLSAEGLITLERVMHDGTKIRAHAGVDTFRREARVRAWLEEARQQVVAMGDPRVEEVSQRVAKARQRAARERTERLEQALEELKHVRATKPRGTDPQQARVSVTDPEARVMKHADGGYVPSYNVQVSTDAAAGAIVGIGATQAGSDYRQLGDSVTRIEANLRAVPQQLVVDGDSRRGRRFSRWRHVGLISSARCSAVRGARPRSSSAAASRRSFGRRPLSMMRPATGTRVPPERRCGMRGRRRRGGARRCMRTGPPRPIARGARASRGAVRASPRGGRSVVRKTIRASRPS